MDLLNLLQLNLADSSEMSLSELKWNTLRQSIFKILLEQGEKTISDISQELQNSIPTITKGINQLISEGLVVEDGKVASTGGRSASVYKLKASCAYFLGIEANRSSTSFALQDIYGEFVEMDLSHPFVLENTKTSIERFCELILQFVQKTKVKKSAIVAACINLSGRVNTLQGRSINYLFDGTTELSDIVSKEIGIKTFLENDSRAMALGEYKQGVVADESNVLFLNYSWGIGVGLIVDGKVHYGKSGYSGEFGHSPIFDNQKICHCGKIGCLETEVSGWSLVNKFIAARKEGRESLIQVSEGEPAQQIYYKILSGVKNTEDGLAVELIIDQCKLIGRYLSILLNTLNPELVILGGDFSDLGELVMLPIQTSLRKHSLRVVYGDMNIKISKLGSKAGIIGACQIVRERFLQELE